MASTTEPLAIRLPRIGLVALIVVSVAGCGRSRTADEWLKQLKDPDVLLRRQACRELGNLAGDSGITAPALADALKDEDEHVRRDAAMALGKLGPDAGVAVDRLIAVLKDKDKRVRAAASAALKKIDAGAAAKAGVK